MANVTIHDWSFVRAKLVPEPNAHRGKRKTKSHIIYLCTDGDIFIAHQIDFVLRWIAVVRELQYLYHK